MIHTVVGKPGLTVEPATGLEVMEDPDRRQRQLAGRVLRLGRDAGKRSASAGRSLGVDHQ